MKFSPLWKPTWLCPQHIISGRDGVHSLEVPPSQRGCGRDWMEALKSSLAGGSVLQHPSPPITFPGKTLQWLPKAISRASLGNLCPPRPGLTCLPSSPPLISPAHSAAPCPADVNVSGIQGWETAVFNLVTLPLLTPGPCSYPSGQSSCPDPPDQWNRMVARLTPEE